MKALNINGKLVEFALVSRRSALHAGTRFNVRGSDDEGNPANFVETEQILVCMDVKCSYVQLRGSIPLYWTQKTNLKYKPLIKIDNTKNHVSQLSLFFMRETWSVISCHLKLNLRFLFRLMCFKSISANILGHMMARWWSIWSISMGWRAI